MPREEVSGKVDLEEWSSKQGQRMTSLETDPGVEVHMDVDDVVPIGARLIHGWNVRNRPIDDRCEL